jgi:hypothetical protein
MFVPLIDEHGWREEARRAAQPRASTMSISELIPRGRGALALPNFDDPAFGALFDRFANTRVVQLREASRGTVEILPCAGRHHATADRAAGFDSDMSAAGARPTTPIHHSADRRLRWTPRPTPARIAAAKVRVILSLFSK